MSEPVADSAPLLMGALCIRLGEDGADRRSHHLLGGFRNQRKCVSHEVYRHLCQEAPTRTASTAPSKPSVRVAGYKLHPTESSGDQRTQEGAQNAPSSLGPTSKPKTSLSPVWAFTPTAITTAVETTLPSCRAFT